MAHRVTYLKGIHPQKRIDAALLKANALELEVNKAPYKFIAGWVEGATIENENSPLNDLWENLLLAGLTDYKSYLEIFTSILRELGGSEVSVLKRLAENHGPLDIGSHLVPAMAEEGDFPHLYLEAITSDESENDIWSKILAVDSEEPVSGYKVIGAIFHNSGSRHYFYHPLYQQNDVAFELLARERLIDVVKSKVNCFSDPMGKNINRQIEIVTARLTQLGISFAKACMFPEQYVRR